MQQDDEELVKEPTINFKREKVTVQVQKMVDISTFTMSESDLKSAIYAWVRGHYRLLDADRIESAENLSGAWSITVTRDV